ncbi:MAG: XdhC family protein [Clostridia bacterium]|nr:XdhC family protein [Clostridia bacterium]MCI1999343.1 XdhC family protein [Clostridia bacterium]MCI2015155.1 XdhC family protein [Clostridia bacterium]
MDINKKVYENVENRGHCLSAVVISGVYQGSRMISAGGKTEIFGDAGQDFWNGCENVKSTDICKIKSSTVFFKYFSSHPKLYIFGGGHVARELCKICAMCGFSVTVIDDREEFVTKERFEDAEKRVCCDFESVFDKQNFAEDAYFAVLTRGHSYDQACIENILKLPAAYVGMIGSRKKVVHSFGLLKNSGFSGEDISRINSPIGLEIGAKTPAEIAVSIAAQMIQVKNTQRKNILDASLFKYDETNYILLTVAEKEGSSPAEKGAMMVVFEDRTKGAVGTVGGGNAEFMAVKRAYKLFDENKEFYVGEYDMDKEDSNTKMVCGGRVKIVFEKFSEADAGI